MISKILFAITLMFMIFENINSLNITTRPPTGQVTIEPTIKYGKMITFKNTKCFGEIIDQINIKNCKLACQTLKSCMAATSKKRKCILYSKITKRSKKNKKFNCFIKENYIK